MPQRRVFAIVDLVVKHGMPVEERASPAVLANESAVEAIFDQGRVGHGLGKAPIHVYFACRHSLALVDNSLHASVQFHVRRQGREVLCSFISAARTDSGVDFLVPDGADVGRPVDRILVADHSQRAFGHRFTAVQPVPVVLLQLADVGIRHDALLHEPLGVQIPGSTVLAYPTVHYRLSRCWLVCLVMSMAPITNQVDDNVLLENVADTPGRAASREWQLPGRRR